jgi:predicted nucleotidyltransferase
MGGNFLQRGEPAFMNKWARTMMALNAGVDIIIELPFIFASQNAREFANAGIQILNSLGIIDYIVFGCENNQMEILNNLAEILITEPDFYKRALKEEIKNGFSFPKIRERAVTQYFQKYGENYNRNSIKIIKKVLRQPNNILALEYLISLKTLKSTIKPILKRDCYKE